MVGIVGLSVMLIHLLVVAKLFGNSEVGVGICVQEVIEA